MAGSITPTNQFAAQAGPIPLSQLDANFSQDAQALNSLGTFTNYYQDTGTVNTWIVTVPAPQLFSYGAGVGLQVKVANTVTGAVTLNVNGLGAKAVTNPDATAVTSGQVVVGAVVDLIYDGTQFQLKGGTQGGINTVPNSRTISTTAPLTGGGALSSNLTLAVNTFGPSQAGVVPQSGGGQATFLRADGQWQNVLNSQLQAAGFYATTTGGTGFIAALQTAAVALQVQSSSATRTQVINVAQNGQNQIQLYQPASSNDLRFFNTQSSLDTFIVGGAGNIVCPGATSGDTLTVGPSATTGALIATNAALTNNAGASAGTLTNAPSVGNPTKWIKINDNGTIRSIPAW